MQDPAIGKEVDGYRIRGVLGRGGMGVVYKAEDTALSRTVALKRIDPSLANDETFLRRFRSEARALARIDSPYIVGVHALRKTGLGLLIVMEYVDGGTLKDRLVEGAMDLEHALPIIQQMLAALEDAHGAEVIHRDIKPQNIMLTEAGRVKVTDFGLAKVHRPDTQGTVTQGVYGTLNYMSPEQVQGLGQVDHRSDIYSIGVTIYEMLAGRLPFDPDDSEFAIMRTIVEEELPPPDRFRPALPRPLVQLVMKALAKDPDVRFQSAAEMQRAFQAFQKKHDRGGGASSEKSETAASPAAVARAKLRRAGVAVGLVLLLGVGGFFVLKGGEAGSGSGTERNPLAASGPVTPTLSVSTEPTGAAVFLNGRIIGSTPLSDVAVGGDSLAIRLQKDGYRSVDTTLHLSGSANSALNVQLAAVASAAEVAEESSKPASDLGNANTQATGEAGGPSVVEESSGETSAPSSPAQGTLRLGIEPSGTVLVDGDVRSTGSVTLAAGRHTVRFRHPRYGAKDTTVTVAAGQTLSLTCYFEQTISVNHEGAWGNVWVNGENTGQSTPHTFTRGPGTYRIEFRIRREGHRIPEGTYYKSVGERRFTTTFSGNEKQITVTPTFTPTKHALLFHTVERTR